MKVRFKRFPTSSESCITTKCGNCCLHSRSNTEVTYTGLGQMRQILKRRISKLFITLEALDE